MLVRVLSTQERDFARQFAAIRERGAGASVQVETQARKIVDAVRRRGDRALVAYTRRFDGVTLSPAHLRVSDADIAAAQAAVAPAALRALRLAARRIAAFHRRQRVRSWSYRDTIGLRLGQQITPLRRVGLYVPGGHAAYPSSVLMNAIPARVAGVREVVMVSPAGRGGVNPAVLAAAAIAGIDAVYRIGGAQAVAALAYGTKTIAPVDKIVGPGNAWVQAAKKIVYGTVDIDKIAGPSEVLVIADRNADPEHVAADLLAQAEHGSGDECAVLLTPSRPLAFAVQAAIERQLQRLPRRGDIARVLRRRGALVVVRSLAEAVEVAESVAPEHLELMVARPRRWAGQIRNAGALFLGPFAPAPLGDYVAGPNHVLPTGGTARFFSPLGVYDFVKRTSVVSATRHGLRRLAPAVIGLATLEGYDAHAAAVRCRFTGGRDA
ncbi:MAG TPA: histidinol dehydrogenase [Candidatus Margulisiibacteriota bacterium]|nr:histidinol dehydrogenase [Candidatus Margulisiibacteriota bacterium]